MTVDEGRLRLLLGMQVALLGMITPQIRGITCGWIDNAITLKFLYDGPYSEDDEEDCEDVVTEIMSHFPEHQVELQMLELQAPESLKDQYLQAWVYLRKEG